jgi:signal transduction histidine kinase
MAVRSLRMRVIIGSAIGGLSLVALTNIVSTALMLHGPFVIKLTHSMLMGLGALLFFLLALTQVRRGLAPFDELRARLQAVRDGSAPRVTGQYPSELQPLVDDLNGLLDDRERTVDSARAKAGDLAHGLKTPLAVLSQEADRAEAAGQHDLAVVVGQQVERMRRQVDYHLAHARAAARKTLASRANVRETAEGIARTLRRLHGDRGVAIDIDADATAEVRCERQDLEEMLGNLLDNACAWAARRVRVRTESADGVVTILVEDDGPGLAPELRATALQRGVRADEAGGGSGLGLAIVRDLAELHGGTIALESSALGGLCARLMLRF